MCVCAFCVILDTCVVLLLLKFRWNPSILTCVVVCTGVLCICMSLISSSSCMCLLFVAILHLFGFTCILQRLS